MGVLKEAQVVVCGMRFIDLNIDTLKILDTHFSNNEKLKEEKKLYKIVANMQTSFENMENDKAYPRKKNSYF